MKKAIFYSSLFLIAIAIFSFDLNIIPAEKNSNHRIGVEINFANAYAADGWNCVCKDGGCVDETLFTTGTVCHWTNNGNPTNEQCQGWYDANPHNNPPENGPCYIAP